MKGILGTTVSANVVARIANAILEIAQTEDGVTIEVIVTAVAQVSEAFATDAEMKKRPPKRSI